MGTIALLAAIVLSHTDGDTFAAQVVLKDIYMSRPVCRRLFADPKNSPEIYPGIFVTPKCGVVVIAAVRIAGIDTPEVSRPQCERERTLGLAAAQETATLLPVGSTVTLKNARHDKFAGRVDATVFTDVGVDVGNHLKQRGHAVSYSGQGPKEDWCKR